MTNRPFEVGDLVALVVRDGCTRQRIEWRGVVEKKHKTGHVIVNGQKFRANGSIPGDSIWTPGLLMHLTPELEAEMQRYADEKRAEDTCARVAHTLSRARGVDAVRLAAMLPPEMKGDDE